MIKIDWATLRDLSIQKNVPLQWVDQDTAYHISISEGPIVFYCSLNKDPSDTTDLDEFEDDYKALGNAKIDEKDYDNRTIVHNTPRYRGSTTCYSSVDDSQSDPSQIWGGSNKLKLNHVITDPLSQVVYMDFNTVNNKTYVLSGLLQWKDCDFDEWCCHIVPKTTTYSAGVSTNYNLFGGYLIIPASGDGTITVNAVDMELVAITQDEYGNKAGAGYWNADYNTTTKVFENITAAPLGDGNYNMFGAEVQLYAFVNNMIMLGDGQANMTSFDAAEIGHGMRLKFTFLTIGTDHNWEFTGQITLFREKTT